MTERQERIATVIAFVVVMFIMYTNLSAECATGGSCTFASGQWFEWIATTFFD